MWLKHRELFLQEMIRLEGRCNRLSAQSCSECNCPSTEYRCWDCLGSEIYCSPCILLAHKWNGQYFERISLKTLGLRIQLGHTTGQICLNPHRAFNDDFIVVDTHGIHEVSLDFCNCATAQSHIQQLLQILWFPSTTSDPKTAATFCVLEHYHLLSFESKVSAFKFYNALNRMSDNTGLLPIKDRYDSFTQMICEWRHLKMLKCLGRGHDPSGVDGTVEGEWKNLPAGWKDAPRHTVRWLYGLFLTIDVNFRLKRKAVSSDSVDPSLSCGWGYFVEDKAYKDFLHSGADSKSTCSSHNAVNMADTKYNRGLATTGLGTVDCACHNMKLPNAVGDLQKGERYINMDYLFFSALRHTVLNTLNVSYDIACQWHKKLWHHMSAFPVSMYLSHAVKTISFLVPKFHLPTHIEQCQTSFSFNFKNGVGRTDGEAPEHTLDDYFGDSNWKKVVGLGHAMLHKIKNAFPEHENHREAFEDLDDGLQGEYGPTLKQWREQVEAWEEDEINLQTGTCLALHEDCTPSILISTGLELEEQQRRMKANRAGLRVHATDNQEGKMVQQSNTLRWRIDTWMKMQELYMPSLAALHVSESSVSGSMTAAPEAIKLWLPSQISRNAPCNSRLQAIEWKLRYAQGHHALRSLCSNLHAQTAILKYKDRNLHGQGANTRARNTLKAVQARIEAAASTYEYAHKALVILSPRVNQTGERAMRWAEEVELLKEEMRRILQFLEWDAQHWDERSLENTLEDAGEDEREGRMAYAKRQASLRRMLAESFKTSWTNTLALVDTFDHNSLIAQQDMDMDT
ncbi:hypothetical protein DFJ58DRAFT_716740 [Suillus subalutaceus]|uniref:uncharacterized protein n=1 Tax=Suillus subalutaceus TaxID=48586 RepID=UPI001B871394|nr:uncharacterized protein DFJ58DRAFT_716740 [Suillus subalutaceus]KAG1851077.1 hypothetical protein DFJ58DRAFT_716740 [Suillus subalutaceus]